MQWIVNKKYDLLCFIGPVVVSYIFLSIYYGLNFFGNISLITCSAAVYFIWTIFFDSTHIFATYTRTYFDRDFRSKNYRLIYGSLLLLLAGPLYLGLFYFLGTKEQFRAAFIVFNRFGILYAYYHLIRQHWGFMMIYNRKNSNCTNLQIIMESILLWTGTIYPLIYHHIHFYIPFGLAEKMAIEISIDDWDFVVHVLFGVSGFLFLIKSLYSQGAFKNVVSKLFYIFFFSAILLQIVIIYGINNFLQANLILFKYLFLLTFALYVSFLLANKVSVFSQKFAILVFVIVTNNFILSLNMPYIAAYACITVFHNIQYHAIIQFYNQNKYLKNEEKYGLASSMTKNILLFILASLGFNLFFTLPKTVIEFINVDEFFIYLTASFFWGVGFHHYVIDSIIWRPSRDTEVRKNLGIAS